MTVIEKAYAKINLMLDVVGKRPDGYHDLVTVMQSVSLCDTLTVSRREDMALHVRADAGLPTDEENLAVRAIHAYFKESGAPFGVSLVLKKQIPMQAGLGGGSSDAAAMLRALNRLDGDRFSPERLCEIGATIGADVPFCVMGGTRVCRGIGEQMQPIKNRLQAYAVVAMAGEGISTPRAFADLDERYGDFALPAKQAKERLPLLQQALEEGDLPKAAPLLYNRFEELVAAQRPAVGQLLDALRAHGAIAARMSGSGPAVFGLFSQQGEAHAAAEALQTTGARAFFCDLAKASL